MLNYIWVFASLFVYILVCIIKRLYVFLYISLFNYVV